MVEEAIFGFVLPSDKTPGILAVVVAVEEHGQARVDKRQAVRQADERPSLPANDSGSYSLQKSEETQSKRPAAAAAAA